MAAVNVRQPARSGLKARSDASGMGGLGRELAYKGLSATLRHPGRVLATLLIAGTAGLIARNALTMQTSRHPAPLFGTARPAPAAAARRNEPVASPVPPARPQAVAPAAVAPAPPTPPAAKPATRDRIGDLIRAEATGSTSAAGKAEPQRSVVTAQKALTKLGYGPLKADGVMGSGTKQALEKFERDRHLPETGELGPKTSRELAARAGVALE